VILWPCRCRPGPRIGACSPRSTSPRWWT
jgi:hypothetical protein